jgi:3-dehydroquinate synthase
MTFTEFLSTIYNEKKGQKFWLVDKQLQKAAYKPWINEDFEFFDFSENQKTLAGLEKIFDLLDQKKIRKDALLIGVGGGAMSDLLGLASSLYSRGISLALMPSTTLSAVDAAIGGKNGLNFKGKKNQIGLIRPADYTIIDMALLKTQPEELFYQGFSEIIKYALIHSSEIFDLLTQNTAHSFYLDLDLSQHLFTLCAQAKLDIVSQDLFDTNIRKHLNFGHSLGHALELHYTFSHADAVGLGMIFSLYISEIYLDLEKTHRITLKQLLDKFKIKSHFPDSFHEDIPEIISKINYDKKNTATHLDFIALEAHYKPKIIRLTLDKISKHLSKFSHEYSI